MKPRMTILLLVFALASVPFLANAQEDNDRFQNRDDYMVRDEDKHGTAPVEDRDPNEVVKDGVDIPPKGDNKPKDKPKTGEEKVNPGDMVKGTVPKGKSIDDTNDETDDPASDKSLIDEEAPRIKGKPKEVPVPHDDKAHKVPAEQNPTKLPNEVFVVTKQQKYLEERKAWLERKKKNAGK